MDAKLGCVLGMIHERTCNSTQQVLHLNITSPEAVKTVVLDMWKPFHKAIKSLYPFASIVVDRESK
ncbi:transposase [Bacillus spongiae]|uniref:Transposase n=1 Tax=Bacillus spongiae TaxID=2683610 RepID=A0ABU8HC79_9BACI